MVRTARPRKLWLDYGEAASEPLLVQNLSGVAVLGRYLWTASDEGRTIECLVPSRHGFQLHKQVMLDDVFDGLPGAETDDEADLESLSLAGNRLWICGSHCRVRRQFKKSGRMDPRFRGRPSRRLLGTIKLTPEGDDTAGMGEAFPFRGAGSLRHLLARDDFIGPFVDLPSKENGLDIEGMTVYRNRLLLGLRGPIVDSIAIIADIGVARVRELSDDTATIHFLDLGGLGVRDLTQWGKDVLILAGPVSAADGPFRLFRWRPRRAGPVEKPLQVHQWDDASERPEGICRLDRDGAEGLIILYDTPDSARIDGTRYCADWLAARDIALD